MLGFRGVVGSLPCGSTLTYATSPRRAGHATTFALASVGGARRRASGDVPEGRRSGGDVVPGSRRRDLGGQFRARLASGLSASPPSATLVSGGGLVTSFWWARRVFAMAVEPAATDLVQAAGS